MANIPWGKPRLFIFETDEVENDAVATGYELATPVEDSTELSSEKGDKMEAKIEGGENEDVKYKRSTYSLAYNIRKLTGRRAPFPTVDGVVEKNYGIIVMPEDNTTEGFMIEKSTVSIDDTFTAADGAIWNVQQEALKPSAGDTVKWGKAELVSGGVKFTERSSKEGSDTAKVLTINTLIDGKGGCPDAGIIG